MTLTSNDLPIASATGARLAYAALAALVAFGVSACGGANQNQPQTGDSPPPLIERALFFGDPTVAGAQISPDGELIAFLKPYKGVRNIWVKGVGDDFEQARPMTADTRPVSEYFWSRDGRYLLYAQDKGGNENFHLYAVDPTAAPEAASGVPAARDLSPIDGIRAVVYDLPKNDPNSVMVGLNDRDPSLHDVYRVNIATGERELVVENRSQVLFWSFDLSGALRLATRQTESGGNEILRVDGAGDLVSIYTTTLEESAFPIRFHPDGKRTYLVTNKGDDVDVTQLMLLDVTTGETELVERDPEQRVDFGNALFDERNDELLATVYVGDRQRIYPHTDDARAALERLRESFPNGELGITSTSADMSKWLVSVSSDVDPGTVYIYHRDSGELAELYRSRPELPSEHLASMEPVRYTARDGLEIPAYLTVPRGVEAKNLPTVILPHGGPWARDRWGYNPYAQFLANRGYVVLAPNFRGSTGYGKRFLNAGNFEWGTGAMQHDITDGVKWLIERGIADADRICIFGGSYGGYATLAGVTFTPDLYKCGVPYVAPSNLITLMESFPAYWRPFLQGTFFGRVGDPAIPEQRADLEARSPINFVDRIKVPLLVVHGANDPRVTQIESDQIVVALREKGHAVEYIVAPDEGHGFRSPENRMALAVAMERFFAKHLGGRMQESVSDDVSARLAAITVDVSTVKKPDLSASANAMTAPLPTRDGSVIEPGEFTYAVTLTMGAQNMDLSMQRIIGEGEVEGRKTWRITDVVKMPMGEQKDTFDIDRQTLLPIQRRAVGMGSIELDYSETAVKGVMKGMGQTVDIDIALPAPVFGEGAGVIVALAGMPLAEGYEAVIRQIEPMTQKVFAYRIKVTGSETTKVEAGEFETLVVEMTPIGEASGSSVMRVLRDAPHYEIQGEHTLPASMGGATLKTSLTARK